MITPVRRDANSYGEVTTPVTIRVDSHPVRYRAAKRIFDIVASTICLLLALPVILVIAALVKIMSPGPVFYKSHRIGLGGNPFLFLKFRSMYVDSDARLAELLKHNEKDGPIFKMKDDPRVTPIGRFIRKYSLDELPQFIHVLTGQMSMVGPRPPVPREVAEYNDHCLKRLSVKPGITCYWQIMGRSNLTFDEWMDLDRKYIDEMTFWKDLVIIVKTPAAVLKGRGAY